MLVKSQTITIMQGRFNNYTEFTEENKIKVTVKMFKPNNKVLIKMERTLNRVKTGKKSLKINNKILPNNNLIFLSKKNNNSLLMILLLNLKNLT